MPDFARFSKTKAKRCKKRHVPNCTFTDVIANGGSVRAINAENLGDQLTRKKIDALGEFVKTYRAKALAWIKVNPDGIQSPIAKFLSEDEMNAILETTNAKENDVIFIIADKDDIVYASLGALRLEIGKWTKGDVHFLALF